MSPNTVRCVLIKIHGIGNQPPTWSSEFDAALADRLATLPPEQQAQVVNDSVWWADLSQLRGVRARGQRGTAAATGPGSPTYAFAFEQYTLYLAANDAAMTGDPRKLGAPLQRYPRKRTARVSGRIITAADLAHDVANYVSNNGVRLAIQQRLSDKLFAVQEQFPEATVILGSHSQGTIIAYDVLRLNGAQLPSVETWVTMGCPLAWYLTFGRWGDERLGIQPPTVWPNLYDPYDIVGRQLAGLLPWDAPLPQDINVDNRGQGLDAHDHWSNPVVVDYYFQLIAERLS
jgi:hypothetical protein